ncbi:MAG TPA: hypothetical protein VLX61_04560 [Anaerolineales bacterium]|nr:hypothetical protein [Anaerolineales bacterium]
MFFYDRLNDDYEVHQRSFSYLKGELDTLVADAKVKRPNRLETVLVRVGDRLISVGASLKEHHGDAVPADLTALTR